MAADSGNQVHTGWELLNAGNWDLPLLVTKLREDAAINEYALQRAVQSRLPGPVGAAKHFVFLDGACARVALDLKLRDAARRTRGAQQSAAATSVV